MKAYEVEVFVDGDYVRLYHVTATSEETAGALACGRVRDLVSGEVRTLPEGAANIHDYDDVIVEPV